MIDFLEEKDYDILFEWINKDCLGLVDPLRGTVSINIELLLAETLIHEALHVKYPDWTEDAIEAKTIARIRSMKAGRVRKLGRELMRRYLVQKAGEFKR